MSSENTFKEIQGNCSFHRYLKAQNPRLSSSTNNILGQISFSFLRPQVQITCCSSGVKKAAHVASRLKQMRIVLPCWSHRERTIVFYFHTHSALIDNKIFYILSLQSLDKLQEVTIVLIYQPQQHISWELQRGWTWNLISLAASGILRSMDMSH